ncbi:26 kDa periplasmic immunogenic protein [Bacteroidaceae bacterium]|nr:SIMPL domain-containing protein [Lachnospiraceae bacterium]GFI02792.1 26 kDa periplasmic immunogenic protein [Lachnospiraceae bacterium]GFI34009.1 26 kDa periplasmic immunogenic protein [Bacteroidaceae bacterium]GFI57957.1 26 kDa periplasmic immunogenic protein [Muribaculaceae bacterium]
MKKNICTLSAIGILIVGLTGCGNASSEIVASAEQTAIHSTVPAPDSSDSSQSGKSQAADDANSIIVNSSEKVTVIPDIAQVVYSVRTKAREAAVCQQQNTEQVSQVIELLKGLNVAETSIQTSDYYMNPVYDYSGNTPRVTGYEAITTLTVSDLPIKGLDEVLAQSVQGGINTISSITYQASKYDESYQAALTSAVETARQKAEVLAKAAGCNVGGVINIQETSGYSEARYSDNALTNMYRSTAKEELSVTADSAGIMPGEIQVEASIVVEYQLY